ncbi:hypothetical protein GCM10010961_18720 [Pseudodonghicola xiamenensis]|uniref:Uncharacterized protein n=1 Tax=Pseudodonghicola xiamenensis TaxID=337702 RepID=A0A8J3H734_9RHOB|nr:hypothetical protein GCM10010961_18720 [Pseudodonghicola xiamenensis]
MAWGARRAPAESPAMPPPMIRISVFISVMSGRLPWGEERGKGRVQVGGIQEAFVVVPGEGTLGGRDESSV